MPRYDYECDKCHHRFELKQSFDSEPITHCPKCESVARRQFHSVPIVFKGSGWYVNDYGKRRGTAGASSESPSESPSESKDSSDSDSKSDGESKVKSKSDVSASADGKAAQVPAKAEAKTKSD